MVVLTTIAFLIALLTGVAIVRAQGRAAAMFRYGDDKPQRFHVGHVPRLGGLALGAGLSGAWLVGALVDGVLVNLNLRLNPINVLLWLLVMMPALLTGLMEDMTQRLPVSLRLLATFGTAVLACWLLGLAVPRLDIDWIDRSLKQWPWLAVVLAVMAIAGLPHAFNIIDGYNGLAGTVALLISLALAHVALQVGDRTLAALMMALAGATAGFLIWNYPRGLIFAGDGGAYLWGGVIAVGAIMLVQRNPAVSPWFPLLLLIYPVWETLFSIYRKAARGVSPGVADALHFHQLIFRRLVRKVFHDDHARQLLIRNNRTSPYLWGFTALTVLPAVLFWQNSVVLLLFCGLFVVTYVLAYLAIVRFKVPGWLRR
ncbi:glycosyltransferase [Curvibacter sp. RS43]|uniref:Glycosyltransferase n=1 Tax=Curvibacter microcysteis TaxID=3026419 RepID=A0ABT5MEC2_9BURK|nr:MULTISPECIES: glycosyltransferase [unclassified Curvibacter]MDD0811448.1 glycosyltransferase [Curvibacter sp. RS43]MDD0813451.1 glycosyltransferase [Curvibacter sp. HBC28]